MGSPLSRPDAYIAPSSPHGPRETNRRPVVVAALSAVKGYTVRSIRHEDHRTILRMGRGTEVVRLVLSVVDGVLDASYLVEKEDK